MQRAPPTLSRWAAPSCLAAAAFAEEQAVIKKQHNPSTERQHTPGAQLWTPKCGDGRLDTPQSDLLLLLLRVLQLVVLVPFAKQRLAEPPHAQVQRGRRTIVALGASVLVSGARQRPRALRPQAARAAVQGKRREARLDNTTAMSSVALGAAAPDRTDAKYSNSMAAVHAVSKRLSTRAV